jgi:NifU-like protein involved in Fe-S cluster formation
MTSALYNRAILGLAASLPYEDVLELPDGSFEARSPVCGSRIAVDIMCDDTGALTKIALRANACALGQASAAILRKNAIGETVETLADIRQSIADFFDGKSQCLNRWPELIELGIAKDYPARHAAILLPFDVVIGAMHANTHAMI